MTAQIVGTLTDAQLQQAQQQVQAVANAAQLTVRNNTFVFFAAFDGTNNNANDPLGGIAQVEQSSNVAQLYSQAFQASQLDSNISAIYFPGPGTINSLPGSSAIP